MTRLAELSSPLRAAILGYLEDGPNPVTLAMNGRAATAEERPRLWALWSSLGGDLAGYAALRSQGTAVIVLEPRSTQAVEREHGDTTNAPVQVGGSWHRGVCG